MANRSQSSDLEDPLQVYSGLSLFPRTLKSLSNPLPPPRLYQPDDLQQTHSLLESMPLKIQSELLEQAKAILDSSSELLNPEISANVVSEDENQEIEMNPVANQRERRPGLGRKRARFSLKPTTSQPTPNFEPSFDDSKYQNPEDFFAAYEKFENAKREWLKQTGTTLTDTHQNQPAIRPRRPGISGRKRVTYNHRYSTDAVNLEALDGEIVSPSQQSSLKISTAEHVMTVDRELADSTPEAENNVDSILGELLACTGDELGGDGAVNLLEERLQIKPIDTEKLLLPELQDVRKSNFRASQRNTSKPRTVLSDIQNMLKGLRNETARKNSQTPSPLQSPGDLLSSHKEHMSPSNLQEDQFSFPDINHLLPGDISTRALGQQSSEVGAAKDSNIYSRSSTTDSVDDDSDNAIPSSVDTGDVAGPLNESAEKTSSEVESDTHSNIGRSVSSAEGNVGTCMDDSVTDRNSIRSKLNIDIQAKGNDGDIPISESDTNRDLSRSENDPDICAGEAYQLDSLADDSFRGATRMDGFNVEKDSIPSQQHESSKSPNGAQEQYNKVNRSSEDAENLQEQLEYQNENAMSLHGLRVENAQQEVQNPSREQRTNRGKRGSNENMGNKRSKGASDESEGNKRIKAISREGGRTEQTKRISCESKEDKRGKTVTRESKAFSRRKSLAAAGTKWESGVRRSTRIKSRPLEYWKGERFLYGRIHESLATVIGIKYESPVKGEGGKPALKVKSYVSDEYKELVEQAALH